MLVHLGGIHDEELLAENRGYAAARRNMDVKSSTNGTSTTTTIGSAGSAKANVGQIYGNTPTVYWKKGYGMADNTDRVADRTVPYPRNLFSIPSYVVLRRIAATNEETSYWSLGVIKKRDYQPSPDDYVISYCDKTDVQCIWTSDIKYAKASDGNDHPFKVKFLGVDSDEASPNYGKAAYTIVPGTVNNQNPFIGDVYMNMQPLPIIYADATGYILLNVVRNPDSQYPEPWDITFETSLKSDTNEDGYLALAGITKTPADPATNTPATFTHYSYITGSIICYRVRVGTTSAVYYWSTI